MTTSGGATTHSATPLPSPSRSTSHRRLLPRRGRRHPQRCDLHHRV